MYLISSWFLIWFASWSLFTFKVRWLFKQSPSKAYVIRGGYFISLFVFIYVYYYQLISPFTSQLIGATIISILIGLWIRFNRTLYINVKKDKDFFAWQAFNVLFQQAMILIGILMLRIIFKENYQNYHFGIIFFLGHLPILFLPWAKLKTIYIFYSLFAGIIFSYLINNYHYGLVISFVLHYLAYVLLIYYVKDEEKI
ncbi:MAG TPA: hypothetical protein VFI61_04510 [Patescibacteria group bacterium]|nr:hypothetical protein [Patescibacteria group bacterium]